MEFSSIQDIRTKASNLRAKAERKISTSSSGGASQPLQDLDPAKLLHELQVHQVELEMQNDILRDALRECETLQLKYQELFNSAPVGYLTLSLQGAVLEANDAAEKLLGQAHGHLLNRRFPEFFSAHAQPEIAKFLAAMASSTNAVFAHSLMLSPRLPVPRYFNLQGHRYTDPAGDTSWLKVVMMDVTAMTLATEDAVNFITGFGDF